MIDGQERKPYWQHTKGRMIVSLLPFLVVIVVLPLYAETLNANKFLGFPLGYFLTAHGLFALAMATVARHVVRQHVIDDWHGASDDD